MKKKPSSFFLTLILLLALIIPSLASGANFSDVPEKAWYSEAVRYMAENGLMGGTGADTFGPEATTSPDLNLNPDEEAASMNKITVSFNGHTYPATLSDNSSASAFAELLESKGGSMTIHMSDYGSLEKVGSLGTSLPRNDKQTTTSAGDIILYQGNQITVYYAQNSWNFTRLGRLGDPTGLWDALGSGDVDITFASVE